jgi:hypothetical protein
MDQHTLTVMVLAIVVIAAIAIGGFLIWRQRRSQVLRDRFGPEYDRVVRQEGNQRRAENVLDYRAKRREKFQLRTLEPMQRSTFASRWTTVQSRFVDDPPGAVADADVLINEVMSARGYPMAEFEQRAADISVDHPQVVENYRSAHEIAVRRTRGQSSTEDLRKAIVHYRWLFQELLEDSPTVQKEKLA